MQKRHSLGTKAGCDHVCQDQIQPVLPVGTSAWRNPVRCGTHGELVRRRLQGIDVCVAPECLRVGQTLRRFRIWMTGHQQTGDQQLHLVHELMVIEAGTVPFDHGELGIVQSPRLAVAEDAGDLVDGPAPGRQQSFHGELRGGLQVKLAAPGTRVVSRETGNVHIRHGAVRKDGCVNLDDSTLRKERPDEREHLRAALNHLQRRRRRPVLFSIACGLRLGPRGWRVPEGTCLSRSSRCWNRNHGGLFSPWRAPRIRRFSCPP